MSTIKANTLSNVAGDKTISTDRVAQGTAFAWVNFNGTGTVAIRASYNVTSITDLGTGNYQVNLANAATDADFAVSTTSNGNETGTGSAPTASAFTVTVANSSGTLTDASRVSASAFR